MSSKIRLLQYMTQLGHLTCACQHVQGTYNVALEMGDGYGSGLQQTTNREPHVHNGKAEGARGLRGSSLPAVRVLSCSGNGRLGVSGVCASANPPQMCPLTNRQADRSDIF